MTQEISKIREEVIKTFVFFNQKANIQIDEETDIMEEILAAETPQELIELKEAISYNSCLAILSQCEEIISYYSRIFADTTEYNNELSTYANKLEDLSHQKNVPYETLKDLFDEIWRLFIRLKQNKNNLINQSRWKAITRIYPLWLSILSIAYFAGANLLINNNLITASWNMLIYWLASLIVIGGGLRIAIFPWKKPESLKS